MPQPNYRSAQREVKRFRLDRERDQLPVSNQSTGAWNLYVDEVLRKAQRTIAEEVPRPRYKVDYLFLIKVLITILAISGLFKLVTVIAE